MSQTRRFIQPYQIIVNESMAVNITSDPLDISNIDNVSIVYDWVGTSPVGVLYVQVRNGDSPWSTLTVYPLATISGNTGNDNFQLTEVGFKELRLFYEVTSGVGTMNAYLTGKGR